MGSLLIQLGEVSRLTAKMIAGSDEGSNIDPFADLDKDKDQTEET